LAGTVGPAATPLTADGTLEGVAVGGGDVGEGEVEGY